MKNYAIAIHGGAGTILRSQMNPEKEQQYQQGLKDAIQAGHAILQAGGSSLDAVEAAVMALEDFPLFNAGRGAVFTNKGTQEMDASIMDGATLEAGAICGISHVQNPVKLARAVKDRSGHVLLCGKDAEEFAHKIGMPFRDDAYFYTEERYKQWQKVKDSDDYHLDHNDQKEKDERKFGTVGAVAVDQFGNVAAATSTGGMTNKRFGRVGDSPIIGAGTYANNHTCAVSCTGHGEFFLRGVVAYDVSCLIEYKGMTLKHACEYVVKDKLVKLGGEGGLIAVNAQAELELVFNSEGMYRAWKRNEEATEVRIYED